MRKIRRFWLRGAVFLLILANVVTMINRILTPKYFYNHTWPTTSTYLGFYEMEKDTADVIFLGSSHGASSFSPQVLYNRYGITSYNLSCEQQNLLVSYYWLKEALRYQSPKDEPLNTSEGCTRKALDYMRWSPVKREAVHAVCEEDKNQSLSSYYLPNVRFHTRWTGLNEEDFTYSEMGEHIGRTHGGADEKVSGQDHSPLQTGKYFPDSGQVRIQAAAPAACCKTPDGNAVRQRGRPGMLN